MRAHDLGVTLYDTADIYGLGESERLLGRLLRHVDRSAVVVSSKVGYFADTATTLMPRRRCVARSPPPWTTSAPTTWTCISCRSRTSATTIVSDTAIQTMHELREDGVDPGGRDASRICSPSNGGQRPSPRPPRPPAGCDFLDAIAPECRDRAIQPAQPPLQARTDMLDFARQRGVDAALTAPWPRHPPCAATRRHPPHISGEGTRSTDPLLFQPASLAERDGPASHQIRARSAISPPLWPASSSPTHCTATPTRPFWSASAMLTRSTPPSPA